MTLHRGGHRNLTAAANHRGPRRGHRARAHGAGNQRRGGASHRARLGDVAVGGGAGDAGGAGSGDFGSKVATRRAGHQGWESSLLMRVYELRNSIHSVVFDPTALKGVLFGDSTL